MQEKIAIIVGVGGQDGTILWNFLVNKGYKIIGITKEKNIYHNIGIGETHTDILDKISVEKIIKEYTPHEIYYLAAYHHSSQDIIPSDDIVFKESMNIHVHGYVNILEAIAKYSPRSKVCYASSCLIYGGSETQQQNETTLPVPNSIYAITKLQGMYIGNWFAEKYNLQVINAILYNHESEFRSPNFVSMKIIQGAINISKGLQDNIILGDLSTQVDRGSAYDYTEAMYELLQSDNKGDYIISSGKMHTIEDLVKIVFDYLKLDWKNHIKIDKKIIQRKKGTLFGDNSKIQKDIGWKPKIGFKEMVENTIKRIQ